MVSTAFFKGIIILTRQINFYRNRIFLLTAQNPDFFERIFAFFGVFRLYSPCSAHACCACFTVESACFLPNCRSGIGFVPSPKIRK